MSKVLEKKDLISAVTCALWNRKKAPYLEVVDGSWAVCRIASVIRFKFMSYAGFFQGDTNHELIVLFFLNLFYNNNNKNWILMYLKQNNGGFIA